MKTSPFNCPNGLVETWKHIYVGDSRNVVKRIITNHCHGNVEGSALRKAVAEAIGYRLRKTRRRNGSMRIRIDLSDPNEGETVVSAYIKSGKWKYIVCESYKEAHDFQWYAISKLKPVLNRKMQPWDYSKTRRYRELLSRMLKSRALSCNKLHNKPTGPGVYILLHQLAPEDLKRNPIIIQKFLSLGPLD
ncbi:MAG: GIY-YIG nuclease family protein [Candidatus Hecatellaceae archaeon]|nr:MAG: hypothetical protein DRO43_02665 [Candidatus Hecatellales archaeon]